MSKNQRNLPGHLKRKRVAVKKKMIWGAIVLFAYCSIKLGLFYEPGKFGHGAVAFLANLFYNYIPLLLLLMGCYVLFVPGIKRATTRALLFFLFCFFPAKHLIDNGCPTGIFSFEDYLGYWKFGSMDFRLEHTIMLVVAIISFVVFIWLSLRKGIR